MSVSASCALVCCGVLASVGFLIAVHLTPGLGAVFVITNGAMWVLLILVSNLWGFKAK